MTQESVFLMVKYKSLIAVCSFTTKLSLCLSWLPCCESAASVELGASHRVPQKNKWVSCLSIVRYWVSGLECGQCAKVAGRGERSLVFLTCWDEIGRGGVLFFTMSNFTNCQMSWWFCCLFLFLSFFTQETCLNTCDLCAPEARTGIRENSLWSVHLWDLWNFFF